MEVSLLVLLVLLGGFFLAFALVVALLKLVFLAIFLPLRFGFKLLLLPFKLLFALLLVPILAIVFLACGIGALVFTAHLLPLAIIAVAVWVMIERGKTPTATAR